MSWGKIFHEVHRLADQARSVLPKEANDLIGKISDIATRIQSNPVVQQVETVVISLVVIVVGVVAAAPSGGSSLVAATALVGTLLKTGLSVYDKALNEHNADKAREAARIKARNAILAYHNGLSATDRAAAAIREFESDPLFPYMTEQQKREVYDKIQVAYHAGYAMEHPGDAAAAEAKFFKTTSVAPTSDTSTGLLIVVAAGAALLFL